MTSAVETAPQKRTVGFLLGVGIFFLPIFFVWQLLKPGYSILARVVGFGWFGLGLLSWISVFMAAGGPAPHSATDTAGADSSAQAQAPHVFAVGDTIQSGPFQMAITDVQTSTVVGRLSPQRAADGGIYIVVRYTLKNTSNEPVKSSRLPHDLHLVDAKGTTYSEDAGATGSASFGDDSINNKLWSDLNPGLSVNGIGVFEIAKDSYDPKTWQIVFGDDGPKVAMQKAADAQAPDPLPASGAASPAVAAAPDAPAAPVAPSGAPADQPSQTAPQP